MYEERISLFLLHECLLNLFPQAFVHLNEFDKAKVDLEKVLLTSKLCFVLFLFSAPLCAR